MITECPRLLSGCPVTLVAGENSSAEKVAEDISIPSIKVNSYLLLTTVSMMVICKL
jgi:hypothetical protein